MNNHKILYILLYAFLFTSGVYAQQPVTWTDLEGVEVQPDNTLRKTIGWGTENGGAASVEVLSPTADGWAEFTAYTTGYERYFGLTQNNIGANRNMDYAIKLNTVNGIVIQENSISRGGFGSFADGDILRVERIAGTVYYKKNGTVFYTSTITSTTSLRVDVCLYHNLGEINNATTGFGGVAPAVPAAPAQLAASEAGNTVVLSWHDNAADETGYVVERQESGSNYIHLVSLAADTESYTNTNVEAVTSYSYRVYAYNTSGNSDYSNEVNITTSSEAPASGNGYSLTWTDLEGVEVLPDNSILKTAGWAEDAGAASVETLPAGEDGWAEFTAYATGYERYFGLTQNNTDATRNMDYAIKLTTSNTIVIQENSSSKGGFGSFADGDILRVERTGSTIEYKKNGTTFYTSDTPSATALLVDACLYHKDGEINAPRVSFSNVVVPVQPTGLHAIATAHDKILLQWDGQDTGISYVIEKAEAVDPQAEPLNWKPFARLATTIRGATAYTAKNLEDNIPYKYRIKATNGQHYSGYSEEVTTTTLTLITVDTTQIQELQYNGNISAVRWKSQGDEEESLYTYHYDAMNRIISAEYARGATDVATGSWTTTSSQGGFNINNLSYDLNGNIKSLNRQAIEEDIRTIDALTYSYVSGNQLSAVSDASGWSGFTDKNQAGDDYTYDDNGNLEQDLNKGITEITYNHLNLPTMVKKDTANYIEYIYDASGVKHAQIVHENGQLKRTDYLGEFIYESEGGKPSELKIIQHEEGRVVIDEITQELEYQYHLKDHLGNTRLTFTTKPKTIEFTGRFESETAAEEEELFSNLKETRQAFNSADATASDIHVAGDDEVVMLNNSQIAGPAISLPVGPGDELDMQVYSYYEAGDYGGLQTGNAVLIAVAGAFGGANGGNTYEQSTYDAFSSADGAGMLVSGNDAGDARPAAYLNYILFDEKMNPYKFGHVQITGTANSHELVALNDVVVDKAGFAYIYLSNESDSPLPVFFDDMNVVLSEGNVVQSDNFYPFGLAFNSYQRVTGKENKYLFNQGTGDKKFNTERISDLDLSMDMTKYRTYDYTTGRFMQVDPLADSLVSLSPYNYSYNNPTNYNDPFGDTPCCLPQARKTRLFGNRYTMATAPEPLKEPISAIGWLAGMALEGAWSLMQDQELNAIPFEPSPIAAAKGVGYLDDAIKAIKGLDNLDDVGKIDKIVSSVAKNHELFQCVQCSDDIVKVLKEGGVKGTMLEITTNGNKGMAADIWSDALQTNISTNGTHKAVLVNGKVYDNINPSGVSYNDWVKDLHSPTGYVITETTF